MKYIFGLLLIFGVLAVYVFFESDRADTLLTGKDGAVEDDTTNTENEGGPKLEPHPLSIESLRNGDYPGSDIVIEQTLTPGSNYQRYIASYQSEGLTIYGLLTVPNESAPEGGFPVIIFNHGYIPPDQYRTTERYIAYTDAFSRAGYILFRPDYRGHGNSEGEARGGYSSNAYTIDVLNAVASIQKYGDVNPEKIGMWGHSMGGHITLRTMVSRGDVKAGVIWAGVVASYPDLLENWRRRDGRVRPFPTGSTRGGWRNDFIREYGTPKENPIFWNAISANTYLSDISGPIQLHHGTSDLSVPYEFSEALAEELEQENKSVELFIYEGDDHDLTTNFAVAMRRSVAFFDQYLR